jgi:DNA-binding MarR family transcriptional regulator
VVAERDTFDAGLGFRLGRAHRMLREGWETEIADLGVTAAQASMLRAICDDPGTGLRQLARRMVTDPMNAKRLADHLESVGMTQSKVDPSHAQRRGLVPTVKGLAVANKLRARAGAWNRRLAKRMGGAELTQLEALLARLEDSLGLEPGARSGARSR